MIRLPDQTGSEVRLAARPKRIVSLVPSQTELLVDLGAEADIVGVTKFCVHPPELKRTKTVVGGTKDFKIDVVLALKPDLVVANKEENPRPAMERLAESLPTYVSDVSDPDSSAAMIRDLGALLGRDLAADAWCAWMDDARSRLRQAVEAYPGRRALYLMWKGPYMAAGVDTFISAMMGELNLENALRDRAKNTRYPALSVEDIRTLHPDVVLLSSEPFPFGENHRRELAEELPGTPLVLVDGEPFSWYGTRWIKSLDSLKDLAVRIHHSV